MGYTNSGLVDVVYKSPNHSGTRTHRIDYITPHCVVGQLTASESELASLQVETLPAITE